MPSSSGSGWGRRRAVPGTAVSLTNDAAALLGCSEASCLHEIFSLTQIRRYGASGTFDTSSVAALVKTNPTSPAVS